MHRSCAGSPHTRAAASSLSRRRVVVARVVTSPRCRRILFPNKAFVTCACNHNAVQLNASKEFVQHNAHQSEAHVTVQLHHHPAKCFGTCNVSTETIQYLSQKMWIQSTRQLLRQWWCRCQSTENAVNARKAIIAPGEQHFLQGQ